MRRTFVLALFCAVAALAALTPTAPAAKFDIMSFSVSGLGIPNQSSPDECIVSVTLNYTGKVNSTAKAFLYWQWSSGDPLYTYWSPIRPSGESLNMALYRPGIMDGQGAFSVAITNKNNRVIRQTGSTVTYTTTTGTCPPSGASLGSWTNPDYG